MNEKIDINEHIEHYTERLLECIEDRDWNYAKESLGLLEKLYDTKDNPNASNLLSENQIYNMKNWIRIGAI